MRENSIIKKNILQFLEIKGITKYEFYKKTGISNGVLSQNGGLSEENTLKFLSYFKEINCEWLLSGIGEMLKTTKDVVKVEELNVEYGKNIDYNEKYYEVLEKYYQLSEENKHLRSLLEKNKKLNSQHAQDATV